MILEYMENGDLFSSMRKDPAGELLWYRRQAPAAPQRMWPADFAFMWLHASLLSTV